MSQRLINMTLTSFSEATVCACFATACWLNSLKTIIFHYLWSPAEKSIADQLLLVEAVSQICQIIAEESHFSEDMLPNFFAQEPIILQFYSFISQPHRFTRWMRKQYWLNTFPLQQHLSSVTADNAAEQFRRSDDRICRRLHGLPLCCHSIVTTFTDTIIVPGTASEMDERRAPKYVHPSSWSGKNSSLGRRANRRGIGAYALRRGILRSTVYSQINAEKSCVACIRQNRENHLVGLYSCRSLFPSLSAAVDLDCRRALAQANTARILCLWL